MNGTISWPGAIYMYMTIIDHYSQTNLLVYLSQISGERLQDHWSSGLKCQEMAHHYHKNYVHIVAKLRCRQFFFFCKRIAVKCAISGAYLSKT